ncbi:MAG: 23S rRNA (adenine(2503)-C(2))-methyltransferase RlmN [Desulfatiglandaceae bacterium]
MPADLKGFNKSEMEQWAQGLGLAPYRGRQVRSWLFRRLAGSFEEMTDLPLPLRSQLAREANIHHLSPVKRQESSDGTRKYLFELHDGYRIESVLIPERDHLTICISSQAGCAMGCRFCLTGKQGLNRNLSPSEIVEQVIHIKRSVESPEHLTNIVFMGMGEPLANYDNLLKAVNNLVGETGMNFSHRKVTVSTCGLVPMMRRLGQDISVNLAVSLNATTDKIRDFLMPINRRYPIDELIRACRDFPLPNRRMITFEYILINGINDSLDDASRLALLLSGVRAKINLIALNAHESSDFKPPPMDRILRFQDKLVQKHFTAIIRKSKGEDISAACGQLSGKLLQS